MESYQQFRLNERTNELKRLTQLLRETLERRFCPDAVVSTAIDNLDIEITMLSRDLKEIGNGS